MIKEMTVCWRGALCGVALIAMGIAGFDGAARADGTACAAGIVDNVDAGVAGGYTNSGCEVGSTNNDTLGSPPIQVNIDHLFGTEVTPGAHTTTAWVNVVEEFGPLDGTYDLGATFFNTYDFALITFKDGAGTFYTGYLLEPTGGTTGTYTNPFGSTLDNLSHIRIYGLDVGPPGGPGIPLPGAFYLLLAALGSVGIFGWWRRRATA